MTQRRLLTLLVIFSAIRFSSGHAETLSAVLTPFASVNAGAIYHMTETPVNTFGVTDFARSGLSAIYWSIHFLRAGLLLEDMAKRAGLRNGESPDGQSAK